MKIPISRFPGKVKKTRESDMLIGTSRRESVISPLLLVIVLCGYKIYQFLKLVYDLFKPEFVCKSIKLYVHEVPDIDVVICS